MKRPETWVGIAELEPGMVLAEDLCSLTGVKLLAAGMKITPDILELLHARSQTDPLPGGVWIR